VKYFIEIKETLLKIIQVEADTAEDAIEKIRKLYASEQIVLDADDFLEVSIGIAEGLG